MVLPKEQEQKQGQARARDRGNTHVWFGVALPNPAGTMDYLRG